MDRKELAHQHRFEEALENFRNKALAKKADPLDWKTRFGLRDAERRQAARQQKPDDVFIEFLLSRMAVPGNVVFDNGVPLTRGKAESITKAEIQPRSAEEKALGTRFKPPGGVRDESVETDLTVIEKLALALLGREK